MTDHTSFSEKKKAAAAAESNIVEGNKKVQQGARHQNVCPTKIGQR